MNNELIRLVRIFILIIVIVMCTAGVAIGSVTVNERSKPKIQSEQPVRLENIFTVNNK